MVGNALSAAPTSPAETLRATVCSDVCATEREFRRYEADRERIAAQRREYYRRKSAELEQEPETRRRFSSFVSCPALQGARSSSD